MPKPRILRFPTDVKWNETIRTLPNAHILQTEEWGAFKQRQTGWQPSPAVVLP